MLRLPHDRKARHAHRSGSLRIGVQRDEAYFTLWLRDPESQRPAHMPRLELTETQIAALAAYLSSLR